MSFSSPVRVSAVERERARLAEEEERALDAKSYLDRHSVLKLFEVRRGRGKVASDGDLTR